MNSIQVDCNSCPPARHGVKTTKHWALIFIIIAATSIFPHAADPDFHDGTTSTYLDLTYALVGGQPLKLDLYIPDDVLEPTPLVIRIHGGGWHGGSRYPLPQYMLPLLDGNIAIASVQYRLTGQAGEFGDEPVTFPAQIHDVKGAVRWLRAHAAAYNLDPQRFGVWGASAGGHLAALLGVTGGMKALEGDVGGYLQFSSRVQAVADYYGPTDILYYKEDVTYPPGILGDPDLPESPTAILIGWDGPDQGIGDIKQKINYLSSPYPRLVELCIQAGPLYHATFGDPDFLIVHGSDDRTVPIGQSARLADALGEAGVPAWFVEVSGAGHGGFSMVIHNMVINFFTTILTNPDLKKPGDLNDDTFVNGIDAGILLSQWGACPTKNCSADFNKDNVVDEVDLSMLLEAWE